MLMAKIYVVGVLLGLIATQGGAATRLGLALLQFALRIVILFESFVGEFNGFMDRQPLAGHVLKRLR